MSQPEQLQIDLMQHHRPACSKCGTRTQLARTEPSDEPDHDLRTFECGNTDTVKVKFKVATLLALQPLDQ